MLHTEVVPVEDPAILEVEVSAVTEVEPAGSVTGPRSPAVYAVAHLGSTNMITLRYRLRNLEMKAAEAPFQA